MAGPAWSRLAFTKPMKLVLKVTSRSQWPARRFWAEILLAVVVSIAAFAAAGALSAAARHHVPPVLFGLLLLAVVLAVARLGGILYALPVGVVIFEAFDWLFLPPPRALDGDTLLVLGLFIAMSVIVGGVATQSARRVARSEQTRDVLVEEQEALRRVATLVARQPAPAEVFAAVTEETARLLGNASAHLFVYERDGSATAVASWNVHGPPLPVGKRMRMENWSIISRVFSTGQPARIDNLTGATGAVGENARFLGVYAAVAVPVVVGGQLWGLMAVGSSHRDPLPPDTETRLAAFTELLATAIANTAARTELEQVAAEQAALRHIATMVAEAVPPADVFAAVADEVTALFGVPLAGIFRYEREGDAVMVAGTGNFAPAIGRRWSCSAVAEQSIAVVVQRTGQPVRIDDYAPIGGDLSGQANELGISKAAGVPVLVSGRVWGSLVAAAGSGDLPLAADILERLAVFTELMATAIANSDARTEIERLAGEQAALRRVATLVATGAETGKVFAAVAREVSEVMQLPVAAVQRYEDDDTTTVIAAWGDWPHPYQPGARLPYHRGGLGGQVRRTGRAARVDDYSHRRGAFAVVAREAGLQSVCGAPIIVDGAVWGLVAVASTAGPLADHIEDRLTEFTGLLATAIANTQSRTELTASRARLVAAADETRRRLERDLHDGIQQRLVSLALKARTIEMMAPRADDVRSELSQLADGLGTAMDELREMSQGIHPAILSVSGLGPALETLARRSAVPVELDLDLGPRLGEHVEAAGYYIASEAITNVAKHAHASVIEMRVDGRGGGLTLFVSDDGVGGADPNRGSGIIGLKDRVAALGGTISVLSPPGQGTTMYVKLPADPMAAGTAEPDGGD
jgi:signal transduction histidine kinase